MKTQAKGNSRFVVCARLGIALVVAGIGAAAFAEDRYVVAHCMVCCSPSVAFSPDAKSPEREDLPSYLKPVAMPVPELERHRHDPLECARAEVRLARHAGLDAFGLFQLGFVRKGSYREQMHGYWRAAQEDGTFKVFPEVWAFKDEAGVETLREDIRELLAKYESAWFRIDGRYVIMVAGGGLPDGLLDRLCEPLGGRRKAYVAYWSVPRREDYESVKAYYHRPTPLEKSREADALLVGDATDYGESLAMSAAGAHYAADAGRELWHQARPAACIRRHNHAGFLWERLGHASYYADWMRAIGDPKARVMYVFTWNDPAEDSGIVPDVTHGYAYLELTRHFAARFKTGRPPAGDPERVYVFHHPQVTEREVALPPGTPTCVRHNQQRTPPADFIAVAVDSREPCEVTVETSRTEKGFVATFSEVARRSFGAGMNFWLLYHPLRRQTDSFLRNADPKNVPEPEWTPVYPKPASDFFVTEMPAFAGEREIFVTVRRANRPPQTFRASRPVTDRAGSSDFCTLGETFELK